MTTTTYIKPPFLDFLDSKPRKAADQFYAYATGLIKAAPPRVMRSVPDDERSDMIHDIIVHCLKDNFRVLRQFQIGSGSFEAWFFFVVRNKTLDYLRHTGRQPETVEAVTNDGAQITEIMPDQRSTSPERQTELRRTLQIVNGCIGKLGKKCQLLLRLAADQFVPREIVRVLRLPKDQATKVSEDIRYCRKKLAKMLDDMGVEFSTTSV